MITGGGQVKCGPSEQCCVSGLCASSPSPTAIVETSELEGEEIDGAGRGGEGGHQGKT